MTKSKNILLFVIVLLNTLFFSCNENTVAEDLTVVKGFNYYPLEVGKYITYQLDSIIYHSVSGADCNYVRDTTSRFLKEEVVGTFEDNTGELNYIVERYTRTNPTDSWEIQDVWNVKMTDTQVERVEENLRFIKLVFPVNEGGTWNGNAFFQDTTISLGGETIDFYKHWTSKYEYGLVDEPEEINGISFDSVMTVVQSDQRENKVNYRIATEKYARNIGLIYKEMWILDSQCCGAPPSEGLAFCDSIPWEDKAERGLILRQQVIDFN